MVKIVADSICAPSKRIVEKLDIAIVPINLHFGSTVYRDLEDITPEEFYFKLAEAAELPTTSAPSIERYSAAFRSALAGGNEVICFTVTSELSNSYNMAFQARREFPETEAARIRIIDSQAAGASAALLVTEAAKLAVEELPVEEITDRINLILPNAKLVVMFDTLKYIEKSGRVGKVTAVAGDLFNVKPLIYLYRGKTNFFGRARGKNQAIKLMINEFIKDTEKAENVRVAVTHANAEKDAELLLTEIKARYPENEIDIIPFTSAMGSHAGPGIIGIGYTY